MSDSKRFRPVIADDIQIEKYISLLKTSHFLNWIIVLKGQSQGKIIKTSVIVFWLLNMTTWWQHVHRLELQKFFF